MQGTRRDGRAVGRARCGMQLSQWSRGSGATWTMRSVGQSPRAGRIESIILSRGFDAIRDSRIACKDGFRDTP